MEPIPDYVRRYLDTHNTLSLATTDGSRSWAASVFYAANPKLDFYFVSDTKTRHCLDIAAGAPIAATINEDCADWNAITGVQFTGHACPVPAADRRHVEGLYLGKFPAIQGLIKAPESDQEKLIADRLRDAQFYRITPHWLRYIDNSQSFGHKEEFVFSAS